MVDFLDLAPTLDEDRQETGRDLCYDIPDPIEQCVWDNFQAVAGSRDEYGFLGNNCQTTINETIQLCKRNPNLGLTP